MQPTTIKLIIANDHKLNRHAQQLAICKVPHFQIMGEAVSFTDILEKLKYCRPDILIADDVMLNESLLDYIQALKKLHPTLKIIATSNYDDSKYLIKLKLEVQGLLVGAMISEQEFIKGVEMVSNGENCYWYQYKWQSHSIKAS